MTDLTDSRYLLSCINHDLNDFVESYLNEMKSLDMNNDAQNLLNVLGAVQACLQDIYKKGLGEKETAMLYYGIADRIIADMVDRGNIKRAKP